MDRCKRGGDLWANKNEDLNKPARFKPTGSGSSERGYQPDAGGLLRLVPMWGMSDSELTLG